MATRIGRFSRGETGRTGRALVAALVLALVAITPATIGLATVGLAAGGMGPGAMQPRPPEGLARPVQDRIQVEPGKGLFDFLFGGGAKPKEPEATGEPTPLAPPPRPKRTEPPEPKIVELPKLPDARTVAVIGDSQAAGLATGLQLAFADAPGIVVANRAKPASSLIREEFYDWNAQLATVLAAGPTDAIVVMIGVNERQPLLGANGKASDEPRSEAWTAVYRARLDRLMAQLKATGKPVFWIGMPPTGRSEFSGFMAFLNEQALAASETHDLTFIDIWPGFTDENGRYTSSGPDVEGVTRRLRAADAIHFTRAGQRKLAYFVETDIRALLDAARGVPAVPAEVGPEAQATPAGPAPDPWALPPAPWDKVGAVISLNGAGESGDELMGGGNAPRPGTAPAGDLRLQTRAVLASALPAGQYGPPPPAMANTPGYPFAETPTYRRLVRGEAIEATHGRVDDFQRLR